MFWSELFTKDFDGSMEAAEEAAAMLHKGTGADYGGIKALSVLLDSEHHDCERSCRCLSQEAPRYSLPAFL
jgi:hypothetical protein